MTPSELLADAFGRTHDNVLAVLDGLTDDELRHRPGPEANPIGWLVWHLLRVQDDHVAGVGGHDQVYVDFVDRFDLPYDATAIGYGQDSDEVQAFAAPAALLAEYADAVHERTLRYLDTLAADDLDRVVDEHWDPPVTLGVRLVSVADDDAQHVGQAAYVRGLLGR
ncbi:mycothiol transferase [Nocardioides litoris]|uniref:mycothiol transferase n=1 Tax=Nocardioides litoris TaxID=1926648 RepID=UPI001FE51C88|nr:DinB family protein [Nocardioides litoris]